MKRDAPTVEDYLRELPDDRREALSKVRMVIRRNLPEGYRESVGYGMIAYTVPLERFPGTYNGQPLCYAALASQKNHMALYLMSAYGDAEQEQLLASEFAKAGKKLDMGKSCVRFRKLEDLPLDVIGRFIAATPPEVMIARHEVAHAGRKKARRK